MKGNLKLRGDEHVLQSATCCRQILTENIISGLSLFSPPVRALVPMLYTVRRIFVILDWVQDVWINKSLAPQAEIRVIYMDVDETEKTEKAKPKKKPTRVMVLFWFCKKIKPRKPKEFINSYSLFFDMAWFFLIPRFLPKAFNQYLREENEIQRKVAEDKQVHATSPLDKKSS
ncbi:uncharacterized protein LOC143604460 [Bidens hawaiensis]|uniref:uncharacterized protein LOC143604460 n=1 Tax=Bidens hawaiensis TaxID=980011 RepID=UPI00404B2F25